MRSPSVKQDWVVELRLARLVRSPRFFKVLYSTCIIFLEETRIEPKTDSTLALAVRCSNHLARLMFTYFSLFFLLYSVSVPTLRESFNFWKISVVLISSFCKKFSSFFPSTVSQFLLFYIFHSILFNFFSFTYLIFPAFVSLRLHPQALINSIVMKEKPF